MKLKKKKNNNNNFAIAHWTEHFKGILREFSANYSLSSKIENNF